MEATARCEAVARDLLGMVGADPDLKNVQLDIRVQSPDGEGEVQRVYEAWRERCPIYLALTKGMDVSQHGDDARIASHRFTSYVRTSENAPSKHSAE